MSESLYTIKFKEDVINSKLCNFVLEPSHISTLRAAIEELYYFELILDSLEVRGFIGQFEEQVLAHLNKVFLWTHMEFTISYNGNKIVSVDVSEKNKEVQEPEEVRKPALSSRDKAGRSEAAMWVDHFPAINVRYVRPGWAPAGPGQWDLHGTK